MKVEEYRAALASSIVLQSGVSSGDLIRQYNTLYYTTNLDCCVLLRLWGSGRGRGRHRVFSDTERDKPLSAVSEHIVCARQRGLHYGIVHTDLESDNRGGREGGESQLKERNE